MDSTDISRPAPTASPARRTHHAGHVIAIVVGCLMVLPAIGLLVGGGVAASAQAFATDDGYFRFTPDRVTSDGVAVAATDLWLDADEHHDDAPGWLIDLVDVDLRLQVESADPSNDVFVGIARTADVERYLDGARFSDVVELDDHDMIYRQQSGSTTIARPDDQEFWTVSASGAGEQEVEWEARNGRWSVVVMNADGSPDVAADVEIGLRSGAVTPVAVVMIVTGLLGVAGGVVLIVFGARGRGGGRTPDAPRPTSGGPLAPPVPGSAVAPAGTSPADTADTAENDETANAVDRSGERTTIDVS